MYYHCRPLKYVTYGKVFPPPVDKLCDILSPAYRWLGFYTGYFPQVWLSRSRMSITGYKSKALLKKQQYVMGKRSDTKEKLDSVLFGFDIIPGSFPVSFDFWEMILMFRGDNGSLEDQNKHMAKEMTEIVNECKAENELTDEELIAWDKCNGDFDLFLKKYVFVEHDQVVVPSLNLKAAKQIICKDERQKKQLRKMGFIEDRIVIKNIKHRHW